MFFVRKRRKSEANVQAELYRMLWNESTPCYLEYKVGNCRFDLVLLNRTESKVLAIVEVKNHVYRGESEVRKPNITKQFQKYSAFGVPLIYCLGEEQVESVFIQLKKIYAENNR